MAFLDIRIAMVGLSIFVHFCHFSAQGHLADVFPNSASLAALSQPLAQMCIAWKGGERDGDRNDNSDHRRGGIKGV